MSEPESSPCADCGADTTPCTGRRGCRHKGTWEYYMLHKEVWEAAAGVGFPGPRFLCVGCVEARLGRRLTPVDFADVPLNDPDPWDTDRLASRKHASGPPTEAATR